MAMTQATDTSARDDALLECEKLLVWYETGKLDPDSRARLDAYLAEHPQAEAQLATIREERAAAIAASEALGVPSGEMLDRLLARLDKEEDAPRAACRSWPLKDHLRAFLAAIHGPVRPFALAAIVIILVQAVTLGAMLIGLAPDRTYSVASGPVAADAPKGPRLLIAFTDKARMADISRLLNTVGGSIVSGPRAGGLYMIRVPDEKRPSTGIKAIIARLKGQTELVRFATLVK